MLQVESGTQELPVHLSAIFSLARVGYHRYRDLNRGEPYFTDVVGGIGNDRQALHIGHG